EVLGDVAAKAGDGSGRGLLILRDHIAPLLGVELLGERRRAHEVTEEDGQLPALALGDGGVLAATLRGWRGLGERHAAGWAKPCLGAGLRAAARTCPRQARAAALAEAGSGLVLVLARWALHGATWRGEPKGARTGRARAPCRVARPRRDRRR